VLRDRSQTVSICGLPHAHGPANLYAHELFNVCRFLIPGLWGIATLAVLGEIRSPANPPPAMPAFLSEFLPVGMMSPMIAAIVPLALRSMERALGHFF
jgi:hypothetical protein